MVDTECMGRVLVADDDDGIAQYVATLARMSGCEVEVVHDGLAALAALDAGAFDVVILDVHMPEMSGLEVLRCVAGGRTGAIAIHSADDSARAEAMRLGASTFLRKARPDELFGFIGSHCAP